MQREEEDVGHAAADFADELAREGDGLLLGGHAFGEIRRDALAVERHAVGAVAERRGDRRAAAHDVADAVVEVAADEVLDGFGGQAFQRGAVGGQIAVEGDALRGRAVALERVAREGGAGPGVEPHEAVVVVARRGNGAEAAFEELAGAGMARKRPSRSSPSARSLSGSTPLRYDCGGGELRGKRVRTRIATFTGSRSASAADAGVATLTP